MLRASAINNPKDELNHLHHMKQMQMEEWTVWLPISEWIKRLHDDLGVNTTKVRVTAAKQNLVLLSNLSEKYAK
ncbi:hypothetical protein Tco_0639073 [Tanacetum coccineum]